MATKVDHGGDAVGVGDGTALFFEVKSGEDVAGEHGLMEEDLAALRGFVKADAGAEGFDVVE